MMASNILSRFLPSASDEPLPFDDVHTHNNNHTRPEGPIEMDIDDENFGEHFEEQDLENLLADAASSHMTTESTAFIPQSTNRRADAPPTRAGPSQQQWRSPRRPLIDEDDDVPESLLLEGTRDTDNTTKKGYGDGLPPPVPGPSTRRARKQWEATRNQQKLHDETRNDPRVPRWEAPRGAAPLTMDPREKALWLWGNVVDVDAFLAEVYQYYTGYGIWSIVLRRVIRLLSGAFVIGFTMTIFYCIDWPRIHKEKGLPDVWIPKCMSRVHGFWLFLLWIFSALWMWSLIYTLRDIPRLRAMHNFFHYALEIKDRDIQTVEWQHVVARLMALRDANFATSNLPPSTRRLFHDKAKINLDALDIANRIMRRENYLIALFNKEILDVTINLPFGIQRQVFSRTTEFHVTLAVMDMVFNEHNKINPEFLKERNRRHLVETLKKRFLMVGVLSCFVAPFSVCYVLISYVFRYSSQYQKDPARLAARDFTPFAQWKFREFNELPHLFNRRKKLAYPFADGYLAQFPSDKTEQLSGFVQFVTGALLTVLLIFSLFDSDLAFEITPGKSVLLYMGGIGAVYTVARGMIKQDHQVPNPSLYMQEVIRYTRYEPAHWHNRWHTEEVRREFASIYQNKVMIFLEEIFSMIITPYLLLTKLPACSERIVDFFREFTISVEGLDHVCSFAMFDFKKGGDNAPANRAAARDDEADLRADYYMAKDNKMVASYYGFLDNYATTTGGRGAFNGRLAGRGGGGGNFHPPPAFPSAFVGGMSGQWQQPEVGARTRSRDPPRHPAARRTQQNAAGTGRPSPMNSILLDPHHQPSSALRPSPRQMPHSRYRSSLQPVSHTDEDGNRTGGGKQDQRGGGIEEEESIGDSWKTSRLAQDEDEEVERGGDIGGMGGAIGGERGGAGVLQLLRQFSKAQAEGRGTGAGI